METQDSNWSCSCSKNFPSSIVVVHFLAFERETSKWRTVWVGRWLQGAADRAAEGWQGEGVAMETGELGRGLQYHSIPASVTWLLVRPELRNSPNMNWRNISRWRAATKNKIIIILCFYWWLMVYCLGDYRSRKSHSSWGPGVFNFNTLTFMLNFGRYVFVSKRSIVIVRRFAHRESSWWRFFTFICLEKLT